jgi:hypothetical protein
MQCIFFLQSWCTNHIMPWWVYRENKYLKRKLTELSSFSLWSDMELHLYCYYIYTTEIKNNWITGSVLSLMSYPHVICKRSGYDRRFIKIAIWNMILPKMIFFFSLTSNLPTSIPTRTLSRSFLPQGDAALGPSRVLVISPLPSWPSWLVQTSPWLLTLYALNHDALRD